MRTLPGVQLTRASDYSESRSSWLVTLPKEHGKIAGMVVRDTDVLLPATNTPWQSFMRMDNGVYRHFDWHRTRKEAEHAVLVEYRLRHDEAEAHAVAEMLVKAAKKAEKKSPKLAVKRALCEAYARRGTGYGACETPLDEYGNCPNAGNHQEY